MDLVAGTIYYLDKITFLSGYFHHTFHIYAVYVTLQTETVIQCVLLFYVESMLLPCSSALVWVWTHVPFTDIILYLFVTPIIILFLRLPFPSDSFFPDFGTTTCLGYYSFSRGL